MTVKVMAVGDSITAQGESYLNYTFASLVNKYDVQFVGRTNGTPPIYHEGVPSGTLVSLDADIIAALIANPPDIVSVFAGTNDIIGGATGAVASTRLVTLLNSIIANRPSASIVIVSGIPYRVGPGAAYQGFAGGMADYVARMPDVLATFAGRPVRYVDVWNGYNNAWFSDDIHPNAVGAEWIGVRYDKALRTLLPALPNKVSGGLSWGYERGY